MILHCGWILNKQRRVEDIKVIIFRTWQKKQKLERGGFLWIPTTREICAKTEKDETNSTAMLIDQVRQENYKVTQANIWIKYRVILLPFQNFKALIFYNWPRPESKISDSVCSSQLLWDGPLRAGFKVSAESYPPRHLPQRVRYQVQSYALTQC